MIKLNGVQIREPSEYHVERYNLTKSGRVASGKMKMDLIAKKRKLTTQYQVISGAELKAIRDVIDAGQMFFKVEWLDNGTIEQMTAYAGAIKSQFFRKDPVGGWYWTDVTIDYIEQ